MTSGGHKRRTVEHRDSAMLRLVSPDGPAGGTLEVVSGAVRALGGISGSVLERAPGALLVVRTRFPRTTRRLLERRGLTAAICGIEPSVRDARSVASLPLKTVAPRRVLWRLLSFVLVRAQTRDLGDAVEVVVLAGRNAPGRWLVELAGLPASDRSRFSCVLSWRGLAGGATALVERRGAPARFLKLAFDDVRVTSLRREHALLEAMGRLALAPGISIPAPISLEERGSVLALVESAVAGRVAAGARADEVEEVFEQLAAWLVSWHRSTVTLTDSSSNWERDVAECARIVRVDDDYRSWLQRAFAALTDAERPRAAVHGDLSMWNVLVQGAAVAIVDWEEASPAGTPLSDLFYCAVDAELASGKHKSRLGAFDAVFSDSPSSIGRTCRVAARGIALDAPLMCLCFHDTWLRHAAHEADRSGLGEFGAIVRERLTARPDAYPWPARA